MDLVKLPRFYKNMKKYKEKLRVIAFVNGFGKVENENKSVVVVREEKSVFEKELTVLQMNTEAIIPEEDLNNIN